MEQTELYFKIKNIEYFIGLGVIALWVLYIIVKCIIDNIKEKIKKKENKN